MSRKVLFFILLLITSFSIISLALSSEAKDIQIKEKQETTKPQMPVNIRVKPTVLEFNCNIERVKKLIVTNISKQIINIKATPQQPWISVEPEIFHNVATGNTVTFNVGINCDGLNGIRVNTGSLIVSGNEKGIVIKVIARPKVESPK